MKYNTTHNGNINRFNIQTNEVMEWQIKMPMVVVDASFVRVAVVSFVCSKRWCHDGEEGREESEFFVDDRY